ncbi:MAG: DUF6057 family protein [Bacteroidaceae bacterium]|nr:DUF6057 family protein [Bacteroidaceae bacterium]
MKKYTSHLYTLIFGILVFVFFTFFYYSHLYYQEQLQLFLYIDSYFFDMVCRPGGMSGYIGAFFTQFYYFPWIGALIIALLLMLLQELVLFLSNSFRRQPQWMLLSFIPSVMYWSFLCDENAMLAGLVALNLTLIAVCIYLIPDKLWKRTFTLLIGSVILYYWVGGVYVLFIIFGVLFEIFRFKDSRKRGAIVAQIGGLLIIIILPLVTSTFYQDTLPRLYWGMNYYRFPNTDFYSFMYMWVPIILVPLVFAALPSQKTDKHRSVLFFCQLFGILFLAWFVLGQNMNFQKEEIMNYDFLVRGKNWPAIIKKAEKKIPKAPMSVADLNLALCQEGQMADRMFSFFQNGPEGLLPTFQRDFTLPLVTNEIYYYLGFINTSQRFAFEAMEAIPNYEKSGRVVKRLAETNLINGEYKVAEKYLKILQKTLFYRKFANRTMKLLGNEEAIDKHPEYGWLRKCRPEKDFLFSPAEKDMMLGTLFVHNKQNRMAFEYLMAYYLLTDNLKAFSKCLKLGESIGYKRMPTSYRQALMYLDSHQ